MGNVNLASGLSNFMTIFNIFVDILKNTTFSIGSTTFSLWQLMWSIFFIYVAINFVYRLIEGD